MEKYVYSSDGTSIHYQETGSGDTSLVFVHGWLGNANWWTHQEKFFNTKYNIVRIDLGGHGQSDKPQHNWTSDQYVDDIKAVIEKIDTPKIILIGHSMSGAYVLAAANSLPAIKAIILVDTLQDLDQVPTEQQAEEFMFSYYRQDFKSAVENLLPQYLFVEETPPAVKNQLQHEFLQNSAETAINALKPLYKMDVKSPATAIKVPVRAINSDAHPTNIEQNKKYIKDYNVKIIAGTGHYPMLEKPDHFNLILEDVLKEIEDTKSSERIEEK